MGHNPKPNCITDYILTCLRLTPEKALIPLPLPCLRYLLTLGFALDLKEFEAIFNNSVRSDLETYAKLIRVEDCHIILAFLVELTGPILGQMLSDDHAKAVIGKVFSRQWRVSQRVSMADLLNGFRHSSPLSLSST